MQAIGSQAPMQLPPYQGSLPHNASHHLSTSLPFSDPGAAAVLLGMLLLPCFELGERAGESLRCGRMLLLLMMMQRDLTKRSQHMLNPATYQTAERCSAPS